MAINDSYTKLLLISDGEYHGSVSFNDISASARTLTARTGLRHSDEQPGLDPVTAIEFNGTTASLAVGGTLADFELALLDYTIEGFFYANSLTSNDGLLTAESASSGFKLYFNGSQLVWKPESSSTDGMATSATLAVDTMYHFAIVREDTTSSGTQIYIDGTASGAAVDGNVTTPEPDVSFDIGILNHSALTTNMFDGFLYELAISVGVARYTANFTPPVVPYTWLLVNSDTTDGSTTFVDSSVNELVVSGVGVGAEHSTDQAKIGDSSIYLPGTSYLNVDDPHTIGQIGLHDFTLDFWAYPLETSLIGFFTADSSGGTDENLEWCLTGSTGYAYLNASNYDSFSNSVLGLTSEEWQHFELVRAGDNLYMFRDGVLMATYTGYAAASVANAVNMFIGRTAYFTQYYDGYLDQFRLSVGVARHVTTGFTPQSWVYGESPPIEWPMDLEGTFNLIGDIELQGGDTIQGTLVLDGEITSNFIQNTIQGDIILSGDITASSTKDCVLNGGMLLGGGIYADSPSPIFAVTGQLILTGDIEVETITGNEIAGEFVLSGGITTSKEQFMTISGDLVLSGNVTMTTDGSPGTPGYLCTLPEHDSSRWA